MYELLADRAHEVTGVGSAVHTRREDRRGLADHRATSHDADADNVITTAGQMQFLQSRSCFGYVECVVRTLQITRPRRYKRVLWATSMTPKFGLQIIAASVGPLVT